MVFHLFCARSAGIVLVVVLTTSSAFAADMPYFVSPPLVEQLSEPVVSESDAADATDRPKRGSVEALARWSGRVTAPPGFDPFKITREDIYD